ncbi:MAG TPA: PQQ-binding-like beta-propeller repeat protein, partial [Anaeromyxobacteraceae bacterium]|nr:PQQ-binding-like beta-propeller repeat protein [Anaeromyxobacteraceae bacterium]
AGGLLLLARDTLEAVSFRTGARRWSRALESGALAATALARGPILLALAGAVTAVDPGTGRTLWRFAPAGARRLQVAAFGSVAVAATDGALLYGLDAAGSVAWRLRLPGAPLFAPVAAGTACVVASATAPGATLVAIDPAAGRRLWEAPLQFAPSAPPLAAHGRVAVAGTVAGDPIVQVLDARGRPVWTAAPPLHGALALAPGPRGALVGRDAKGALLALDRAGAARWQTPAPSGSPPPGHLAPRVVRSAVLAAHEDLAVHDAATGALLGAAPGLAPVRLLVDPELRVAATDAEGVVTVLRLATHLSVV